MKRLHFDYSMTIRYSQTVAGCNYTMKCIPADSARQQILGLKVEVSPGPEPCPMEDSLGNKQLIGNILTPHDSLTLHFSGDAVCGMTDYECIAQGTEEMIYRHPHGLSTSGPLLERYYQELEEQLHLSQIARPLEIAGLLSHQLHLDLKYVPGSTGMKTTAEQAFAQGCGVCQDYAHILIALLHQAGISARYVAGLLIGEGASHAWVEVLDHGCWYGIDPTNDIPVEDSHIRLACGRDAGDCLINRGIVRGYCSQSQEVRVVVVERTAEIARSRYVVS